MDYLKTKDMVNVGFLTLQNTGIVPCLLRSPHYSPKPGSGGGKETKGRKQTQYFLLPKGSLETDERYKYIENNQVWKAKDNDMNLRH